MEVKITVTSKCELFVIIPYTVGVNVCNVKVNASVLVFCMCRCMSVISTNFMKNEL